MVKKHTVSQKGRLNAISYCVVGAAFKVHKYLGPGLTEKVYAVCLSEELKDRGLDVESEARLPIRYQGKPLDRYKKVDLIVEKSLIVEVKSVGRITPLHRAQVMTYLKLSGLRLGLLINFNTVDVRQGIEQIQLSQ